PHQAPGARRDFGALFRTNAYHQVGIHTRRYTGDRRSPGPPGRITADTRVIIAQSSKRMGGNDHPCITRSARHRRLATSARQTLRFGARRVIGPQARVEEVHSRRPRGTLRHRLGAYIYRAAVRCLWIPDGAARLARPSSEPARMDASRAYVIARIQGHETSASRD